MYNLPYFKEKDATVVLDFMRQYPFAFICGCTDEAKPVATQIPVFIEKRDGQLFLSGHLMRNTDHHKAFEQNPQVLCVFTGPHTYVSATWYSDPHQASTWNYMSVHAHGRIRFGDEQDLIEMLRKTSLHFENNNAESATVYDNLPADYTHKLMKAIVAFEIEVTKLENVFKLSQNRDEKSYQQIIEKLDGQDTMGKEVAEEMRKRQSELFKTS
jgi:transcriptional regulator